MGSKAPDPSPKPSQRATEGGTTAAIAEYTRASGDRGTDDGGVGTVLSGIPAPPLHQRGNR